MSEPLPGKAYKRLPISILKSVSRKFEIDRTIKLLDNRNDAFISFTLINGSHHLLKQSTHLLHKSAKIVALIEADQLRLVVNARLAAQNLVTVLCIHEDGKRKRSGRIFGVNQGEAK